MNQTDALNDKLSTIRSYTFHELLQDELLVLSFDKREVTFDAVEVRRVRHIEYSLNLKRLAYLNDFLGFVDLKIVHEQRELLPTELIGEKLNECNKVLGVY